MHSIPPANDGQKATATRAASETPPVRIPRPTTQPKALAPVVKTGAPRPFGAVSEVPAPPPAPRRPASMRPRALPPPLPEDVLLTDADLIDEEDVTQVVRDTHPTAVDVEIDCFSCTEPPPESRPRRRRALLTYLTGLGLVAATGLLFLGLPLASNALRLLDSANRDAAQAPATFAAAAMSIPVSPVTAPNSIPPSAAPSFDSSAKPRSKLSTSARRGPSVVNYKKPAKTVRTQRVLHEHPAKP